MHVTRGKAGREGKGTEERKGKGMEGKGKGREGNGRKGEGSRKSHSTIARHKETLYAF